MMLNRRASSFLDDSGAETAEVLGLWDTELAKRTKGRLMCDQLLRNLGQKWVITSDFSGIDAPHECCRIIANHVVKQLGQSQAHISFVRSCDIGQHQKQFLLLQSQVLDSSAGCVFSDLLDRLPATTRDWIQSASPTKDMPVEEAQAANALVREFVSSQEPLFTSMADAYCHMHRQRCPVFPGWALQRMASTNQASNQSVENRCLNFSPEKKRKQAQRSTPWYEKPASSLGFADSEDDKASDLVVCNIAGLVCTDCTPLGVRKGMCGAGVTEPVHEVWRAEREFLARQSLEDWYFTENSSAYRVEQKQVSDLKKTHDVKHITICPTQLGFLIRRRRMFSFGFDKSRWVWEKTMCRLTTRACSEPPVVFQVMCIFRLGSRRSSLLWKTRLPGGRQRCRRVFRICP